MLVRFHEAAEEELSTELGYLELRRKGLGRHFLNEVRHAVGLVAQFPESAEEIQAGIRRRVLRKFRYSLMYALEPECVLILAVAHHSRRPEYWSDRHAGDTGGGA
jgi:toxin ParE1/3/4